MAGRLRMAWLTDTLVDIGAGLAIAAPAPLAKAEVRRFGVDTFSMRIAWRLAVGRCAFLQRQTLIAVAVEPRLTATQVRAVGVLTICIDAASPIRELS